MFLLFFLLIGYPLGAWLKGNSPYPLPYKFLAVSFAALTWILFDLRRPSMSGDGAVGNALGAAGVYVIVSSVFGFLLGMAIGAHLRFLKNKK